MPLERTCLVGAKGAARTLDSEHSPNILWNDMLKRQRCRPIAIDATLGADSIFFPAIRMLTFHFSQRLMVQTMPCRSLSDGRQLETALPELEYGLPG